MSAAPLAGRDPGAADASKARICILGNPVANRGDPIRIAEEMAMIDCLSRGRLDVGFVRGVAIRDLSPPTTNPTQTVERLWEGIDLVVKAWTTHDGPFNFEGRFWHKRAVNIWPRPYQQPHPPIWITGSSDLENIRKVAERGYMFATFLQPLREHPQDVRRLPQRTIVDSGVPGGGGNGVHAAGLHGRFRGGSGTGRPGTALVHPAVEDRAAVQEPARLCADRDST